MFRFRLTSAEVVNGREVKKEKSLAQRDCFATERRDRSPHMIAHVVSREINTANRIEG